MVNLALFPIRKIPRVNHRQAQYQQCNLLKGFVNQKNRHKQGRLNCVPLL